MKKFYTLLALVIGFALSASVLATRSEGIVTPKADDGTTVTIYWDNNEAQWITPAFVLTSPSSPVVMTPVAEKAGYYSVEVPAETTYGIWIIDKDDPTDLQERQLFEYGLQPVANMVYGPEGEIGLFDEIDDTPAPGDDSTILFKWDNAQGAADYEAEAGTIVYANGEGNRLNYTNTALGVVYHTICLNGKKANINDAAASANASRMEVTFTEPLQEGDVIEMTAFRNKNSGAGASAYVLFKDNGTSATIGGADGLGFVNLNADGDTPDATAPNTLSYTVTADDAGAQQMWLTRDKSGTNLFITSLVVKGQRAAEEPGFEAPASLTLTDGFSTFIELTKDGDNYTAANVNIQGDDWGEVFLFLMDDKEKAYGADNYYYPNLPANTPVGIMAESEYPFNPKAGVYDVAVSWTEEAQTITFTAPEEQSMTVYFDNTEAQWITPAFVVSYMSGDIRTMTPVEGQEGIYEVSIPEDTPWVFFIDLDDPTADLEHTYTPEDENGEPLAPVAGTVYKPETASEPSNVPGALYLTDGFDIVAEFTKADDGFTFTANGVNVVADDWGEVFLFIMDDKEVMYGTDVWYLEIGEPVALLSPEEFGESPFSPEPGVYDIVVTWTDEARTITFFTAVEEETITLYWDNSAANWAKPSFVVDMMKGDIRNMTKMTEAPEGVDPEIIVNLWEVSVPASAAKAHFIDLDDMSGENQWIHVEEETSTPIAPVHMMVYGANGAQGIITDIVGIDGIAADNSAEAVYYNLQGIRVANPEAGKLYIKVEAGKTSKVKF